MARPKVHLPAAEAIYALADSEGRLSVKVTPAARREEMAIGEGALLVKLRAPPQDGAANKALIKLLAKALGTAPSRLTLLRGASTREKLVQITRE